MISWEFLYYRGASLTQSLVSARVSSESQQSGLTFSQKYRVNFFGYDRLVFNGFHSFLPTFYGELETVTETVWMMVFACDTPGSGRSSDINIFWVIKLNGLNSQWSKLRYIDEDVLCWYLFLFKISWIAIVMRPKILYWVMWYLWWNKSGMLYFQSRHLDKP